MLKFLILCEFYKSKSWKLRLFSEQILNWVAVTLNWVAVKKSLKNFCATADGRCQNTAWHWHEVEVLPDYSTCCLDGERETERTGVHSATRADGFEDTAFERALPHVSLHQLILLLLCIYKCCCFTKQQTTDDVFFNWWAPHYSMLVLWLPHKSAPVKSD